jgi:aquaporin Z
MGSLGPALFGGVDAILQLWLFLIFPLVGGLIAGATYGSIFGTGATAPLQETTEP